MSEIEKLYMNAGIEPKKKGYCDMLGAFCPYPHHDCDDKCPYWEYEDEAKYPPFTAEKQLELIKLLCTKRYIDINFTPEKEYYIFAYYIGCGFDKNFDEALAMFVNQYWQDLTEEEKQQIADILR